MRNIRRPLTVAFATAALALATVAIASGPSLAQSKQPAKQAAPAPEPAPPKQIALTEKQVEGFIAANKEIGPIMERAAKSRSAKPDPKIAADLDAVAKKNGFASFAEFDEVASNIGIVMASYDAEAKKFGDPKALIQKEIAAVQADKAMPAKDKKETLAELNDALKSAQPVEIPGNITVVTKYVDQLQPPAEQPAPQAAPSAPKQAPKR